MRTVSVLLTSLLCPIIFAQQFPPIVDANRAFTFVNNGVTATTNISAVTVDTAGNVYLAGTIFVGGPSAMPKIGPGGSFDLVIIKTNSSLDQTLYTTIIGGSADESVRQIKVDSGGNLYLIGSTQSPDFPATTRFFPNNPVGGFVLKVNAAGTALTYGTVLGSRINPLAFDLDPAGAVFVAGISDSRDLPNTPGVLRPSPAAGVDPDTLLGFVAKLNAAGSQLELATYYGENGKWVEGISVRPTGNYLILANGTLAALNTGLSQQLFSTPSGVLPASFGFDDAGNIYIAGTTTPRPLTDPTCPGCAFVIKKFSNNGQQLLFEKYFPLSATTTIVPRIAVTPTGRIYVFGAPTATNFPTKNATQACLANVAPPNGTAGVTGPDTEGGLIGTSGSLGPGDQALMILDNAGNILHSTFFATLITHTAVAPNNGRVYATGSQPRFTQPKTTWNGVLRINQELTPPDKVSPACLVHSATFNVVPLNPGGLMTVFGSGLGPQTGAVFTLVAGQVPSTLAGVSMTVDGRPATMLYVQDRQINFIVPWGTPTGGQVVPVCVTFNSNTTCVQAATAPALPGVFQFDIGLPTNRSAVLNQDGSVNGPGNPAPRGSVVALFMTGGGAVGGQLIDGGVAGSTLQHLNATVTATYSPSAAGCTLFGCPSFPDSVSVPVFFAGAAPGLVLGVNQVNLQIPADVPPPPDPNNPFLNFILSFQIPGREDPVIALARIAVRQ